MSDNNKLSQSDKFKEAARELGADTDEETFDRVLSKIVPVDSNPEVRYSGTAFRESETNMKAGSKLDHWSDCALNSGPARWPMPCDCKGIRGGKQSAKVFYRWGYNLAERLRKFRSLWQARIIWKRENRESLFRFLLTAAKHSRLNLRRSRSQRDTARRAS